jgi:hypothetical protein
MKKITASQKHALMTKLMGSRVGRKKIAAMVQEPLKKLRDYRAVGRKAFVIDELPDGALPIYDMDPETPGYVVGEEGDSVQTIVKSKRLNIPTFEMSSYPKVPFVHVKERRFDIVKRIKQKARDELFREEDRKIFAAMEVAGTNNTTNVLIEVVKTSFTMDDMADAFAPIERHGLRVDKVFLNAINYPVFRKAGRDYVDFETQRALLQTGFLGNLWGAQIFMSSEVPEDTLFLVTEPEYFGVIPVRLDLTVVPADDPGARAFGWSIFQAIGIGIHSELGLQQISLTA